MFFLLHDTFSLNFYFDINVCRHDFYLLLLYWNTSDFSGIEITLLGRILFLLNSCWLTLFYGNGIVPVHFQHNIVGLLFYFCISAECIKFLVASLACITASQLLHSYTLNTQIIKVNRSGVFPQDRTGFCFSSLLLRDESFRTRLSPPPSPPFLGFAKTIETAPLCYLSYRMSVGRPFLIGPLHSCMLWAF